MSRKSKDSEYFLAVESDGKAANIEMGLLGESARVSKGAYMEGSRSPPITTNASIFAKTPIRSTEGFEELIFQERSLYLLWFLILVLGSPLVFRYAMGSNVINDTTKITLLPFDNATIRATTDWNECVACDVVHGVTLTNLTVNALNVSAPKRGNTPSLALFASQDFKIWYSAYKPIRIPDGYIDTWDQTTFRLNNASLACLGSVYHNYLVACLNTQDLAFNLKLGEKVPGPPFNDRCFQVDGICGTPCFDAGNGPFPILCDGGSIPVDLLGSNETNVYDTGDYTTVWGKNLDWIEWVVIMVIFFDTFGNVLRGLPVVSGRPTEIESSRTCLIEGILCMGCFSPFVSEDEAIFLRSLLGRTTTIFHTVGGRHTMQGIYIDCILNEKRGKGEENRKRLWLAWLKFITTLARIGANSEDLDDSSNTDDPQHIIQKKVSFEGDSTESSRESMTRPRRSTMSHVPARLRARTSITALNKIPVNGQLFDERRSIRVNDIETVCYATAEPGGSKMRSSIKAHDMFMRASMASVHDDGRNPFNLGLRRMAQNGDKPYAPKQVENFDPSKDISFDMTDVLPLICFLDGWLEAVKDKEWTYDYTKKMDAMESIFSAAPLEIYFQGSDLLAVHDCLKELFDEFCGTPTEQKDGGLPVAPEVLDEINWTITRRGLPDWNIAWTYYSRARLRPMTAAQLQEDSLPHMRHESTRIKPGAIVYRIPDPDSPPDVYPAEWLHARRTLHKVMKIERTTDGSFVHTQPFPARDIEEDDYDESQDRDMIIPLAEVNLVEKNRGKAGALNVAREYLRIRSKKWIALNNIPGNVQIFMGIIDARHMIAEPEIFWNDALPFFSRHRETGESAKDYGESHGGQQCIIVQYPQFFTNVNRDDFLDNKNSSYYTIWQTLRDCGKATTSSGTNAIWEVTSSTFEFATTSRIEDTGTSQKYIPKFIAVHLPCFVAYGIAKQTEDYIEAVYRWSTGAVELYWSTFFSSAFSHYIVIGIICVVYALACFGISGFWYTLWLLCLVVLAIQASTDKAHGRRPLRRLIVSSVIVMNTMYWISNLVSVVWMIVIPIRVAFYNKIPLSSSAERSLFWGFAATILRLPPAIMTDRLVNMCRFLSIKTDKWNYSMVLWRSSQLYSCSFAYAMLSVITGTTNAFRAKFLDRDLTMWSSFRVSDAAYMMAWDKVSKATLCSGAFFIALFNYIVLIFRGFYAALSMPDVLTKWYTFFLFWLQVLCVFVSVNITNAGETIPIFITLIVCGLNILLVMDITVLLMPSITYVIGRPARPEYVFAFLGITVILQSLANDTVTIQEVVDFIRFGFGF